MARPSDEYRFIQEPKVDPHERGFEVHGDTRFPGNYTIQRKMIVSVYNKSTHWRPEEELDRMGEINEAYHKNEHRRLKSLIDDTKEMFGKAPDRVASMWNEVLEIYEKGL
jgi:hypothetical protein